MTFNTQTQAIVLGGSMAGLLTARVLADHFDRVTIIERDRLPDEPANRKGAPQGRHGHALLGKGLEVFETFFPGIGDELAAHGALVIDSTEDMAFYALGGYKVRFSSGLMMPLMSRALLEWTVRRRALALPNVVLFDGAEVGALLTTDDHRQVIGVRVQRTGEDTLDEMLRADLVVDATGRGSRSPRWLEQLGYAAPPESHVQVNVGYLSRIYRARPSALGDAKFIYIMPTPPHETRGGGIFPIEGDRWLVTVCGWHGDHATPNDQGFLAFAKSLPTPDIYERIKDAEPLSDPVVHKMPSSQRRHYEAMTRFPEGYLVIGDAICSFNPVYGQGMTSAALQAQALDGCLRDGWLENLSGRFFPLAAKVVDIPWTLAVGEDFRYPQTVGPKAPGTDLINWYAAHVHHAGQVDPVVHTAFLRVLNLFDPPTALFHPRVAARVFKHAVLGRRPTQPALAPPALTDAPAVPS